ncbi:lysozyme inhibitor LprI family protein [Reyranella sp.]|uniref:lysozyme inhibitor LprI family protein n=1 Tax=Reyranella sp. TaxID=1929291 RepID=UPI0027163A37|nr:lysozyme inhibitor LprI family protein [Reyranella sp.]MDO8973469.1 lysozyme inhibitor LprI family protein [Reyranella sp.]
MIRRLIALTVAAVAIQTWTAAGFAQSQMDLNQQAGTALKDADRQLNAAYTKLRTRLGPESRARLQAAEEAWIRFRDLECAFIGAPTTGGSIHGMIVAQCQARLTLVRVKDLETQLNCQEGDLSCVRE